MALDISSFNQIQQASDALNTSKGEYEAALGELIKAIDDTVNAWNGADADQYRAKTKSIIEAQLTPFNEVLKTQVTFLSTVSAALSKTQSDIVTSLQ